MERTKLGEGKMRWIRSLLALLLLAGQHVAAQTPTVVNLSCEGKVIGSDAQPFLKFGVVVNITPTYCYRFLSDSAHRQS
jgi:hypothetical protein